MGLNFYAGCHRCRTKQFFFRGNEAKPMRQFWRKHADCIRADKDACVVQGDGYGEQDWMTEYADDEPEVDTANAAAKDACVACVRHFINSLKPLVGGFRWSSDDGYSAIGVEIRTRARRWRIGWFALHGMRPRRFFDRIVFIGSDKAQWRMGRFAIARTANNGMRGEE